MKKCGIYIFEIISGNQRRIGQKYVGKTINEFRERECRHWRDLRLDESNCTKLQNYYNKYGENSLKFMPLMECPEKEICFWEKFWIKAFDSYHNGLNCTEGGEKNNHSKKQCTLKNAITGEVDTCDSYKEFAEKHNLNESNIGAVMKGIYKRCKEWYNPDGNYNPVYFKAISPEGKEYTIWKHGVMQFCKENSLNYTQFAALMSGKCNFSQGWKRPDSIGNPYSGTDKEYKLISPDGQVFEGKNISKLARDNNLNDSLLSAVMYGKQSHHKGWRLYKEGIEVKPFDFKEYKFVSPDGKLIITDSISKLCKEYNLPQHNMATVHRQTGNTRSCRGWTAYKEGQELKAFRRTRNKKI